jgi:hypothetical protein
LTNFEFVHDGPRAVGVAERGRTSGLAPAPHPTTTQSSFSGRGQIKAGAAELRSMVNQRPAPQYSGSNRPAAAVSVFPDKFAHNFEIGPPPIRTNPRASYGVGVFPFLNSGAASTEDQVIVNLRRTRRPAALLIVLQMFCFVSSGGQI